MKETELQVEDSYEERFAKAKVMWIAGNGSLKELSAKYNISEDALEKRCSRERWRELTIRNADKMSEKSVNYLKQKAERWIEETFGRAEEMRKDIDACRSHFAPDEQGRIVMDMLNIRTRTQAEKYVDDLARRSLGLPDAPKQVDVTSGGLPLQESILQTLRAVGALKDQGKLDTTTIDVEALVNEPVEEE